MLEATAQLEEITRSLHGYFRFSDGVPMLAYDRNDKASLYGRAGIDDYWIVNIEDQQVEVYRGPAPDIGKPFGYGYADVSIHKRGETIWSLAKPEAQIAVADLLP